jgi:hypothetical protein
MYIYNIETCKTLIMSNTKLILDKFLTAMQNRDLDSMLSLYADSVRKEIPGDTIRIEWLGKRSSQAEIRDFFNFSRHQQSP